MSTSPFHGYRWRASTEAIFADSYFHPAEMLPAPIGTPEDVLRTPSPLKQSSYAPVPAHTDPSPVTSNASPPARAVTSTPPSGTSTPSRNSDSLAAVTSAASTGAVNRSTASSHTRPSGTASQVAVAGIASRYTAISDSDAFPTASVQRTNSSRAPDHGSVTSHASSVPSGANGCTSTVSAPLPYRANTVTDAASAGNVPRTVTSASHVTPSASDSPRSGSIRNPATAAGGTVSTVHDTDARPLPAFPAASCNPFPTTVSTYAPSAAVALSSPDSTSPPLPSSVQIKPPGSATATPSRVSVTAPAPTVPAFAGSLKATRNASPASPVTRSTPSTAGPVVSLQTIHDMLLPLRPSAPFTPAMPAVCTTSSYRPSALHTFPTPAMVQFLPAPEMKSPERSPTVAPWYHSTKSSVPNVAPSTSAENSTVTAFGDAVTTAPASTPPNDTTSGPSPAFATSATVYVCSPCAQSSTMCSLVSHFGSPPSRNTRSVIHAFRNGTSLPSPRTTCAISYCSAPGTAFQPYVQPPRVAVIRTVTVPPANAPETATFPAGATSSTSPADVQIVSASPYKSGSSLVRKSGSPSPSATMLRMSMWTFASGSTSAVSGVFHEFTGTTVARIPVKCPCSDAVSHHCATRDSPPGMFPSDTCSSPRCPVAPFSAIASRL